MVADDDAAASDVVPGWEERESHEHEATKSSSSATKCTVLII